MASILAGVIRKGTTFEYNNKGVYTVTDFQHVKPGKGAAFGRATLKNVVREIYNSQVAEEDRV